MQVSVCKRQSGKRKLWVTVMSLANLLKVIIEISRLGRGLEYICVNRRGSLEFALTVTQSMFAEITSDCCNILYREVKEN